MKIETNSHVSQGDRAYFRQGSWNRKICSLNFDFHEVSAINNLKTFLEKIKDWKIGYQNVKSTVVGVTSTLTEKLTQSMTFLLFASWQMLKRKFQELSLNLCEQFLSRATVMVISLTIVTSLFYLNL